MAAAQGLLVTRGSDPQPPPAPVATPAPEASPPKEALHSLGQFVAKESEASGGSEESEKRGCFDSKLLKHRKLPFGIFFPNA